MNNKILKTHKIDQKYVLSERKFLYTFGYLCLEDELIKNKNMSNKQLYYFLEQRLNQASELDVTLENVVTGKIILVGRGNCFRAYYRPEIYDESLNEVKDESTTMTVAEENESDSIVDKSISYLLQKYYENENEESSVLYLEELLSRTNLKANKETAISVRRYKNKIKCYKKSFDTDIDK